jgi:hypothetical protein
MIDPAVRRDARGIYSLLLDRNRNTTANLIASRSLYFLFLSRSSNSSVGGGKELVDMRNNAYNFSLPTRATLIFRASTVDVCRRNAYSLVYLFNREYNTISGPRQSIYLPIYLSLYLSISISIYLYIYLYIYLSISISIYVVATRTV